MPIYINKNGQQLGPFEETKVIEMLKTRQLLPDDFCIKDGQQQWQKLGEMFPQMSQPIWTPSVNKANINSNQPIVPNSQKLGSKGIMFGLIGCGGLLFIGIIGLAGFIALSGNKPSPIISNTNVTNTNSVNSMPKPSPTFDSTKYSEMLAKEDELFKLSPPAKLVKTPIIKAKVLVVEKLDPEKDASTDMVSEYSLSKYGIKTEQVAKNLEELQTLVQIKCSQGKEIGRYGPRMSYFVAYSSICVVSIIDYNAKQTIAKKTFVDAKPPKTIPGDGYDYINDSPNEEIEKYLTGLIKE